MKKLHLLMSILLFSATTITAQIGYDWPTGEGEAVLSTKYKVYVKQGENSEEELEVIMSDALYEGDYRETKLKGRTFSFVNLSYFPNLGELTFRVEKLYSESEADITLSPKSYELDYEVNDEGTSVTFSVDEYNKYIAVNFFSDDNLITVEQQEWQKHMLCIFIDPYETNPTSPTDYGVVVYDNDTPAEDIKNAQTIYFEAGYHNLAHYKHGGIIADDGVITLQNGQGLYIEGGAFVEGLVERENYNNTNQSIKGRGILSGRQYTWYKIPGYTGKEYHQIVELGNKAIIQGVSIIESPHHGIVGREVDITNLKFLGWHCNNDGIRVGYNSEISNSFMRCVDDFFYNFGNTVRNCVLWAGHNGSIMTYGWGGGADSNTYNSGGSTIEDVDIINCEWTGLGNNNGLIMAQTGLDYKPYDYGDGATTTIKDVRIEGKIPGLINLKPRSDGSGIIAVQVPIITVGYLGKLTMEDITVEHQFAKGRITGVEHASTTGNATYYVKDVILNNIKFEDTYLNTENVNNYIEIDEKTTKNITITSDFVSNEKMNVLDIKLFMNANQLSFQTNDINTRSNVSLYSILGQKVAESKDIDINNHTFNLSFYQPGVYILSIENNNGQAICKKITIR